MIILLDVILTCTSILLIAPVITLLLEVLMATITLRSAERLEDVKRSTFAVLVPAHNEASVIGATIRSILPQLSTTDQLLVVADNCSDETAAIAAAEGARVVTRTDATLRGKGYALDFGVRQLRTDIPEVLIIIDADCRPEPGAIEQLARTCARSGRPVQALYLMHAPEHGSLHTRVAEFAWIVKNKVRPLGLHRLGLPCQLMGTGMAFPGSYIAGARLATGHIVEDLTLGIDAARAGKPPLFCPEALVTSTFPTSPGGIQAQRTRWEHGHLGVILREAPRLLLESLGSANPRLMALSLDLSVPPLALLALLLGAVWVGSLLLYVFADTAPPLTLSTAALLLLVLAVFLAWVRYGRDILTLGELVHAAFYAVMKVPLYIRFVIARQTEWVRSKRDGEQSK